MSEELELLQKTLKLCITTWKLFNKASLNQNDIIGYKLFLLISLDRAYRYGESIFLLCKNGYINEAIPIVRSVFELYITVKYIDSNTDLLKRYVGYQWIRRKRINDLLKKHGLSHITKESKNNDSESSYSFDEIEDEASNAIDKYGFNYNDNSWLPKSLYNVCEDLNEVRDYDLVYRLLSDHCHSNIMTASNYDFKVNEDGKLEFLRKQNKDTQSISTASMLRVVLEFFEKEYKLGIQDELDNLFSLMETHRKNFDN